MIQVMCPTVTVCTSCCWWPFCRQEHLIQVWSCWRASKQVESLLCLSDGFRHREGDGLEEGHTQRWNVHSWPLCQGANTGVTDSLNRVFLWDVILGQWNLLRPSLLTEAAPRDTPHGLPMWNTYSCISLSNTLPHVKEKKIPFVIIKPYISYQHWILLLPKPTPTFPQMPQA